MFQGFPQSVVDFMWGIRFNNEKSWFEQHKQEYLDTFQRPMKALCDEVYERFITSVGTHEFSHICPSCRTSFFSDCYSFQRLFSSTWFHGQNRQFFLIHLE